jgi:hypothetical protein
LNAENQTISVEPPNVVRIGNADMTGEMEVNGRVGGFTTGFAPIPRYDWESTAGRTAIDELL